jgi:hypothetical protein
VALDFAESQLHKQIQSGEVSSTIFYLKTKGKKRGYVERSEVDHSGSMQNVVTLFQIPDNGRRIEYKDNQAAGGLSGEGSK